MQTTRSNTRKQRLFQLSMLLLCTLSNEVAGRERATQKREEKIEKMLQPNEKIAKVTTPWSAYYRSRIHQAQILLLICFVISYFALGAVLTKDSSGYNKFNLAEKIFSNFVLTLIMPFYFIWQLIHWEIDFTDKSLLAFYLLPSLCYCLFFLFRFFKYRSTKKAGKTTYGITNQRLLLRDEPPYTTFYSIPYDRIKKITLQKKSITLWWRKEGEQTIASHTLRYRSKKEAKEDYLVIQEELSSHKKER